MSFTDEALKAKLSTLNETQDSIVSVSQWIMFHKRHADRIAHYWLTRLRDSPPAKRLNFIYLVNDIVQNARARKRPEFPDAFSPLMPEAISTAYRSSPPEIQSKIRRVVEVWRTRNVFDPQTQEAIEARIDQVDKSKGSSGKKTLMGQSLFSSNSSTGMPKELETLAPLQVAVTKETISARPAIDAAQNEYVKLNDPDVTLPSPPVHAARLSSLIKSLAAAESSVSASIKARKALIADLERILDINKSALAKDEQTHLELHSRKISTEAKKREVEDGIIRGLSSVEPDTNHAGNNNNNDEYNPVDGLRSPPLNDNGHGSNNEFNRPEIEALTPEADQDLEEPDGYDPNASLTSFSQTSAQPPSSSTTPNPIIPNNPAVSAALARFAGFNSGDLDLSSIADNAGGYNPSQSSPTLAGNTTSSMPVMNSNSLRMRSSSGSPGVNGGGSSGYGAKRRKLSHGAEEEMVPDFGEMGMEGFGGAGDEAVLTTLDEDVDELIRQGRGDS
ncbi:hypothetical protein PV10_07531 [Exophiala mesophila]|uniref:CID domain-containing protein n=1 Tax=Exophiala mesophila TaxID=212818 RepID=A0A0D1WMF3_EXOME|nr:uncharacterized protein PV10_07531 [Exophiala mesophila]KIV90200.1 hypothetical protein PV10_07531 [Exophiala mesophila]